MSDIQTQIQNVIQNNKVVVFMKGTPESPMCGFSAQSIRALREAGAQKIEGINVMADPNIRQGIKEFTNWPTLPQVFINGEFIGGCDIVTEMLERGELKKKLGT
ncbi:MAG: Grx4 family monothiol glutaredoxin [Deltaproteobacteria bacterium]|nr:Grx4 family monothiol glutaredoxin [Deltaproteobacteria bacterium]